MSQCFKAETGLVLLPLVVTLVIGFREAEDLGQEPNKAHLEPVTALQFSPDSSLLASASLDGSIKVWSVSNRSLIRGLNCQDDQNLGVAVHPGGTMIATGTEDGLVRLWHIDGRLLRTLVGHTAPVRAVAFTPDGTHLISGGDDQAINLWNTTNGKRSYGWKGHDGAIRSIAFSPAGDLLASGGADTAVRIWRVSSGFKLQTETLRVDDVHSVAFSPDGSILASSGLNEVGRPVVQMWEVTSGLLLHSITGPKQPIYSLAFAPKGDLLAFAGGDKVISLFKFKREVNLIKKVWLAQELEGHVNEVRSVSFFPDGQHLLSGSLNGSIRVWDVQNGVTVQNVDWPHAPVTAVAPFAGGGQFVGVSKGSVDGASLQVWKRGGEKAIHSYSLRTHWVCSLSFSPDNRWLASSGDDKRIRFWDVSSGSLAQLLPRQEHVTRLLAWSPDGQWLASAGESGTVRIWRTSDGQQMLELSGGPERISRLSFSSDGSEVLAEGEQTVWSWRRVTGEQVSEKRLSEAETPPLLTGSEGAELATAAPNGRILATADQRSGLHLWSLPEKQLLCTLTDFSRLSLKVHANALPVFRLHRSRLGAVCLTTTAECGDANDGRCRTSNGFLLVRFHTNGRFLTLQTSKIQVSASRPEILQGGFSTPRPDVLAVRLNKGFDLAAGEEIRISGTQVSSTPGIFGEGAHLDWRFERQSNRWEMREFVLLMDVYPELQADLEVSVISLPEADVQFTVDRAIVARPLKELQ